MKIQNKTSQLIRSALFSAVICVLTIIIHIPTGANGGYIHPGDAAVIMAGSILGPFYGAVSAAIGSTISDIIMGSTLYAPATLVIKAVMAIIAGRFCRFSRNIGQIRRIVCPILCTLFMVCSYFAYDVVLFGYAGAVVSVPANIIQALSAIVITIIAVNVLKKIPGADKLF